MTLTAGVASQKASCDRSPLLHVDRHQVEMPWLEVDKTWQQSGSSGHVILNIQVHNYVLSNVLPFYYSGLPSRSEKVFSKCWDGRPCPSERRNHPTCGEVSLYDGRSAWHI